MNSANIEKHGEIVAKLNNVCRAFDAAPKAPSAFLAEIVKLNSMSIENGESYLVPKVYAKYLGIIRKATNTTEAKFAEWLSSKCLPASL